MESSREELSSETVGYMQLALDQAQDALDCLELPVGCVLVKDGKVVSSGRNPTTEMRNATRHAEMEAIDPLLAQWQKDGFSLTEIAEIFSQCILHVTCEPCIMCAATLSFLGASILLHCYLLIYSPSLGIKEVYYGCANDKFGGCGSILSLHSSSPQPHNSEVTQEKGFKCTGGVVASEAEAFYEQGNPKAPKPHRPVAVQQATHL